MSRLTILLFALSAFALDCNSQENPLVVFYNVENLFDTIPFEKDHDRTPSGSLKWTGERYNTKLTNIVTVLTGLGFQQGRMPDIIGLAEVENYNVVYDLIRHPLFAGIPYGIVHRSSPDERGIDVALLYNKNTFVVSNVASHKLILINTDGYRDHTRDQLVVSGYLDGTSFACIVVHWPSRSGGITRSASGRRDAALLTKHISDSIMRTNTAAGIVVMGDMNDDPKDVSIKKVLRTSGSQHLYEYDLFFNPMENLLASGTGSLAYRDKWHLFDQILIHKSILSNTYPLAFSKAGVFKAGFMIQQNGRYRGYPLRTYSGGSYTGGYSDHFPVWIRLTTKRATNSARDRKEF